MRRSRDSELWEAATVIALGCATLLALAYLLALWKPLTPARRARIAGGFFDRHDDGTAASAVAPAPVRPQPSGDLPFVVKDKLPVAAAKPVEAQPAASARSPAVAEPDAAPDQVKEASPQEAAAAGVPVTPGALRDAGAQVGLFDRMMIKVVAHPRVVKFILNNKLFNDALYSNPWTSKACNDKQFLQSYLANGSDPHGVSREMNLLSAILQNPESTRAAANTRWFDRLIDCPATQAVARDPKAVAQIAQGNPATLGYVMNPLMLEVLGSKPKAADAVMNIQQTVGGGAMAAALPGADAAP